jgi:hypothetical protein
MSKKKSEPVELCELLNQEEHEMSLETAQLILQEIFDINDEVDPDGNPVLRDDLWKKHGFHEVPQKEVNDSIRAYEELARQELRKAKEGFLKAEEQLRKAEEEFLKAKEEVEGAEGRVAKAEEEVEGAEGRVAKAEKIVKGFMKSD